jgi:putative restriction endonuclease
MEFGLPLVYFVGVRNAAYKAIHPIYVIGDHPELLEFTLGYSRSEIGRDLSLLTPAERNYAKKETRVRLHQPIFRQQILHAYSSACAVCHLKHSQLLDAAHIISDSKPRGEPVVPNGIAHCKIHHAAYDRNFMGIRPDREIVIKCTVRGFLFPTSPIRDPTQIDYKNDSRSSFRPGFNHPQLASCARISFRTY